MSDFINLNTLVTRDIALDFDWAVHRAGLNRGDAVREALLDWIARHNNQPTEGKDHE